LFYRVVGRIVLKYVIGNGVNAHSTGKVNRESGTIGARHIIGHVRADSVAVIANRRGWLVLDLIDRLVRRCPAPEGGVHGHANIVGVVVLGYGVVVQIARRREGGVKVGAVIQECGVGAIRKPGDNAVIGGIGRYADRAQKHVVILVGVCCEREGGCVCLFAY